jgi:exosortase/archaeosortase family protein
MTMPPAHARPLAAAATAPAGNGRWCALQRVLRGRLPDDTTGHPTEASTAPARPAALGPHGLAARAPLAWLGLQAAALWPHGRWAAARLGDGSDDPLGLLALAAFAVLLVRWAPHLRRAPRATWLAASAVLTLGAAAAALQLPPLLAAVIAALALGAALAAWLPEDAPRAPLAGLLLLALPLVASLQFYAGYPLRVITAAASAALLRAGGLDVVRSGVTLEVGGQLVIVDAPCSGVQLAWLGYFCACAVAAWLGLREATFWRRLPAVGALVLGINVLRNAALVALEARPQGLDAAVHEGIGLVAVGLACTAIVAWMGRTSPGPSPGPSRGRSSGATPSEPLGAPAPAVQRTPPASPPDGVAMPDRGTSRGLVAWAAALLLAALWPLTPLQAARADGQGAAATAGAEWPRERDGQPLRPLALSPVEARFAANFPGRIARFDGGSAVWVLRDVTAPTRMLHPATDCYRGLGYRIGHTALEHDARGRRWRCFVAERGGRRVRVCERIEGRDGQSFTDTSAWYWAAALGRTHGPWRALTRVETAS